MNYKEIENLKTVLTQMLKQGCRVRSEAYGVDGKVIGIGFKPYWTNPVDSKIDKLEFNILDRNGRVAPFYLYNLVGYTISKHDEKTRNSPESISLDIHVFSPVKSRDEEPYDKVHVEITGS